MCGICGVSGKDPALVKAMHESIAHRGPDAAAVWSNSKVTLGHRRLAIIDLSKAAQQPMHYSHGKEKLSIVFNGEIYNFQEIKTELLALGFKFTTKSDTEVILASYCAWGVNCVKKFNGMWAFCIYDEKKDILFLSRDRFGKKPLYYSTVGKQLTFASELKAFHVNKLFKLKNKNAINQKAIELYFGLGFIPAPHTIYNEILKLEAAHNLIYDLKTKQIREITKYYELPPYAPTENKTELIKEGRILLKDAVRLRLIADVPVGAFLSGGLDSSTVVAEMANFIDIKKLHTFSVGFSGTKDETPYMQIVSEAFHTQHHHITFSKAEMLEYLKRQPDIYDEPYSDYSGLPITKLSAETKKFVTVALSGDGGDEVFGGYNTHLTGRRLDVIKKIPKPFRILGAKMPAPKNLSGYLSAYLLREAFRLSLHDSEKFYSQALPDDLYIPPAAQTWMEQSLGYWLKHSNGDLAEAMRMYDLINHAIPDHFLVKVDRASMASSLEVRSPFLDYRVVEFGQRIPRKWKVDVMKTKKLMREIIHGIVPDSIVNRGKQGFTSNEILDWFDGPLCEKAIKAGLASIESNQALHEFFKDKVLKNNHNLYKIHRIRLILFGLWWQRWVK